MNAQGSPAATAAQAESYSVILDDAASGRSRKAAVGKLVFTILAAFCFALALAGAVCLLPENPYQRWQLLDGTIYGQLRWMYERIHFDPKPIDIAILGSSRTQLGLSAAEIEHKLALDGKTANVVNFSLPGAGRNLQWAIVDELYKAKSPKAIVLLVDDQPYPFGHTAFKYVAPAEAIVSPPTPLLHNYLYDLAHLPARKVELFGANLFPNLFGLSKQFDLAPYAKTRTDFSTNFPGESGKMVDMEHPVPRATLLAQTKDPVPRTLAARVSDSVERRRGSPLHLNKSPAKRKRMEHN